MPLAIAQSDLLATVLFYLFAGVCAGSALWVVISRNIVRTAVALLFALLGVAGLYFLLHAEFLAAVQLVIYAGGTLILIIFGVMLTNRTPFSRVAPSRGEVLVAGSAGVVLMIVLIVATLSEQWIVRAPAQTTDAYPVGALGIALLREYLLPFELISVLLLSVMIGAAYLAKGRRRE